jgi:multisubunit Na+/H+ antiporter MnhB subunit
MGLDKLCFDHVKRGLQIGSVFGTIFVLPYTIYKDMKNLRTINVRRVLQKQAAALTLGIGVSMVWMLIRYLSWQNKT